MYEAYRHVVRKDVFDKCWRSDADFTKQLDVLFRRLLGGPVEQVVAYYLFLGGTASEGSQLRAPGRARLCMSATT